MGFEGVGSLVLVVGFAIQLLFVVGILVLIALAIRWLLRNSGNDRYAPGGTADDGALVVLRERYARGEIDAAEFEERKRILSS